MDDNAHYPIPLLASRASSISYAQLSALLELLPTKDDTVRKQLLLHYVLQTRHTFARLLTVVRWLKLRHNLVDNALRTEDAALSSVFLFEDVADSLWSSNAQLVGNSSRKPAVTDAADMLIHSPSPSQHPVPGRSDDNTRTAKPFLSSEVSEVTQHPYNSPSAAVPLASNHAMPCSSPSPDSAVPSQQHSSSLGSISPAVTERLAIATRNCIRESLLHLGPLRVLSWRSGIADVCVRIGLPNLWSADVSLENLDPESPSLRAHAISLHVAHDVDAPALHLQSPKSISPTPVQYSALRRMADDRMSVALQTARAVSGQDLRLSYSNSSSSTTSTIPMKQSSSVPKSTSQSAASAGSTSKPVLNPICVMLCALHDMMLHDVCAPLAMSALRSQARALVSKRWGPFVRVEGADLDTPRSAPLVIHYWTSHREPARIRITEFRMAQDSQSKGPNGTPHEKTGAFGGSEGTGSGNTNIGKNDKKLSNGELEHKAMCFSVVHDPPLPSSSDTCDTFLGLHPGKLNVENVLLSAVRRRILTRLNELAGSFRLRRYSLRLNPCCVKISTYSPHSDASDPPPAPNTQEHSLHVSFSSCNSVGMEIRIFPLTGGIRVRAYGAAAIALALRRPKFDSELWDEQKQFSSASEETESIMSAFETIRSRVKLNAAARSLSALDIGVSCTLPPGTASVAATASPEKPASQLVPPFAPLERRAPRRFLTLSPPPPPKDVFASLYGGGLGGKVRLSSSRGGDRIGPTKRPRLTYATTSDALVFIQESSFAGEDWHVGPRIVDRNLQPSASRTLSETDCIDRYSCTAAAAAAWAVTRDIVERRLRRDSLLRAFVQTGIGSAAQMHHMKSSEGGDLHLDSASRVLLKVKCEPLPVRRAELLLRGYDAWQVRLSLLPSIFDSTDPFQNRTKNQKQRNKGGNLWSVGVCCTGSQLTFTYPSANTETVRSFFRDITRARTAAALARGVPPSRFYRVLRRSPVRIVVGIGPFQNGIDQGGDAKRGQLERRNESKPLYTATVEYVYSKGHSGGFSLSFSPSKKTMEDLVPLIEEALDASGGQVGGILAGLLERACPVAAAAESALRERGSGKIRFVTALRVRAVFIGVQRTAVRAGGQTPVGASGAERGTMQTEKVLHAVDVDARGGSGLVTVIDVGRATAVMIQQGLAHPSASGGGGSRARADYVSVPRWDDIVAKLPRDGHAEAQRAGSTVVLRMEMLEQFLSDLVTSAGRAEMP